MSQKLRHDLGFTLAEAARVAAVDAGALGRYERVGWPPKRNAERVDYEENLALLLGAQIEIDKRFLTTVHDFDDLDRESLRKGGVLENKMVGLADRDLVVDDMIIAKVVGGGKYLIYRGENIFDDF